MCCELEVIGLRSVRSTCPNDLRSLFPVSRILEILGGRCSLIVIRDLFLGRSRFKEFMASPEGIPTNILTDPLQKLTEHGLIKKTGCRGCQTTPKGKALRPTLQAMVDWSLKYEAGT